MALLGLRHTSRATSLLGRRVALRSLTVHASQHALPPLPNVALPELILERSRTFAPDSPALIDGPSGRVLTYGELEPTVRTVAANFAARGVVQGSTIGVLSPNCIEYPIALHAAWSLGAKVTTINPMYTPTEVATQLKDAGATQLVVGSSALLDVAYSAQAAGAPLERLYVIGSENFPAPAENFAALLKPGAPAPPPPTFDPATHVAAIPYSSGTSGLPKGVELTHRNIVANVSQCMVAHTIMGPDDTLVGVLPFYHIYGLTVILNIALCSGSAVVTMPKFDPELFLRVLKQHNVTIAHVAPPLVAFLAKHPAVDSILPLPQLKELFSGAAPLGSDLEAAARARLGCMVRQGYGMTEAAPATHVVPYERTDDANGAVGTLLPGMECKIVSTETGEAVGAGESGELCLKGPNVMKGYLGRPEATAESFDADGFYKTGDVGYVDADGLTFVVDRVKELIKVKGFQVAPAELEAALMSYDQIADAAVIGVASERYGEVPKAYVVKQNEALSADDVAAFLKGRVAEFKEVAAENVEFVEAVPKSAAGKILRKELRAMEAARAAA